MEKKEEEAGGGGANIQFAKKKSGIHKLKRKYEELEAKFDNQEEELAEVKKKHKTMVACVVLHTIRICHV